jgi:hypothetical protein
MTCQIFLGCGFNSRFNEQNFTSGMHIVAACGWSSVSYILFRNALMLRLLL